MLAKKAKKRLMHIVTVPFIYIQIISLVILDIFMELYHRINFPIYGIPLVKRSEYIKIDRHKLKYLNFFDKLNCAYCGYANGLIAYTAEIAGRTEKYWCGIRHKQTKGFHEPAHHKDFPAYGDEKAFKEKYLK